MKTIHQKLIDVELDISNLSMFIAQSMDNLHCKMCERQELLKQLYIQYGLEKAEIYANNEG